MGLGQTYQCNKWYLNLIISGYDNVADWWQSGYEVPDFEQQLAKLWADVKPLYQQLHAYVRKRLRDKYGDQVVSQSGPIPAHLLGKKKSISAKIYGNNYWEYP